ncbi:MAG TPA: hypothetical protein VMB50_11690 [Myxococcales bacterium]|nr:hypothetical protein [Myxococcales bacterium]
MLACLLGALLAAPPPTTRTFTLACDTPLGRMKSQETYTFAPAEDPVRAGQLARFRVEVPAPTLVPPLRTHFLAAMITLALPSGLALEGVRPEASVTADYSSVEARPAGDSVVVTLRGDFVLDGRPRPVPPIVIDARVTAPAGVTLDWMPPDIEGVARAPLLGTQASRCRIVDQGPLGETHVSP